MPVEPVATQWVLPDPRTADPGAEMLAIGADLEPGTLLAAYRSGLFPMPVRRRRPIGWWSPDPRGVFLAGDLHVSRSLRSTMRRFTVTVDTCFADVISACADNRRPHGWITPEIRAAYLDLYELGWAHSVEVRSDGGTLVGGLYGVQIGGLFAGESMFHHTRDASKVAVVHTIQALGLDAPRAAGGGPIFDVQWATPHLTSLGAREVSREDYLTMLDAALVLSPTSIR